MLNSSFAPRAGCGPPSKSLPYFYLKVINQVERKYVNMSIDVECQSESKSYLCSHVDEIDS
jgi:hypothetical protein